MDCEREMASRMRELLPTEDDKVMFLNILMPLVTVQATYLCQLINVGVSLPKGIEEAVALSIANMSAFAYGQREWLQKVPSLAMNEHEETHWGLMLRSSLEKILCRLYEEDMV